MVRVVVDNPNLRGKAIFVRVTDENSDSLRKKLEKQLYLARIMEELSSPPEGNRVENIRITV